MNFLDALIKKQREGLRPVIPDIKCYSPKEGELMKDRDPVEYAKTLEKAGAPVLSVVTEEKEFHGSLRMLEDICSSVKVPVLRKDFVENVSDLDETVRAGASAILLMVSCLGKEKLTFLYEEAGKRGLIPLVETHTKEELEFALELQAPLVGINNRNILELERDDGDVSLAKELLTLFGDSDHRPFLVVESSLKDVQDVRTAFQSGADAVLVGTALLQTKDPEKLYLAMSRKTARKICGVMNEKDVSLCAEHYVDMIGFVSEYPVPVPWDIPAENAEKLIRLAEKSMKTCLVTGGSVEKVTALSKKLRPDYVQIHFTETLPETVRITEELHRCGIRVIRSVPSDKTMKETMFGTSDLVQIINLLAVSPVDGILLDSRDAGNAAVGGAPIFDIISEEVCTAIRNCPKLMMIGGGITGENIQKILQYIPADYADIMTGSEDRPGVKSGEKIAALI